MNKTLFKISVLQILTSETQPCKTRSDKSNKRNNWNHITIIKKMSAQHTWKSRNQETTKSNHTGYSALNLESSNL